MLEIIECVGACKVRTRAAAAGWCREMIEYQYQCCTRPPRAPSSRSTWWGPGTPSWLPGRPSQDTSGGSPLLARTWAWQHCTIILSSDFTTLTCQPSPPPPRSCPCTLAAPPWWSYWQCPVRGNIMKLGGMEALFDIKYIKYIKSPSARHCDSRCRSCTGYPGRCLAWWSLSLSHCH